MSVQRFAFAADFRDAELPVPLADLEEEVRRLRAEHAAAFEAGRRKGFAEAEAALAASQEAALAASLSALVAQLGALDDRLGAHEQAVAVAGAELAFEMADHLAAHAVARDPLAAVAEGIATLLHQQRAAHGLTVRIAPALADALFERLADHPGAAAADIGIVPDATLAPGDALLTLGEASARLDQAARRRFVRETVAVQSAA